MTPTDLNQKSCEIPPQKKGGFHNTESFKYFDNPEAAFQYFGLLKKRFFSVHLWKNFCNETFAEFQLCDEKGNPTNHPPKTGDFIKIKIPPFISWFRVKNYDWVKIIEICHQYSEDAHLEKIEMTCQPSQSPLNHENFYIQHFYSANATSTFSISRDEKTIQAAIYGRNETPNFNTSFWASIRNFCIAVGGILGFSKIQWIKLTDGFLDF